MATPPTVEPIDLRHAGNARSIGTYLVETDEGLALVDCGPASCLEALADGLAARGLRLADVALLLLTHIHLDHAGAAGTIVREHPSIRVYVSGVGAPHLVDPARLEASARRLYGDSFDHLWGELLPVPAANVTVAGPRVAGLDCLPAPGHAAHHVAYLTADRTLYAGDAAGVRIAPGRFVLAPTPPPEIDLEAWAGTIALLEGHAPARLALTHFGVFDDVLEHLERLRGVLHDWSQRVADGMDEMTFVAAARADCAASDPDEIEAYDRSAPYWQCYRGLERYWRKRGEAKD